MENSLSGAITTALTSLVDTATPVLIAIFGIAIGFFATKFILKNVPNWFKAMGGNKQ